MPLTKTRTRKRSDWGIFFDTLPGSWHLGIRTPLYTFEVTVRRVKAGRF